MTEEKYKVTFLPDRTEVMVSVGTSIMNAAAEAGVELDGPCGGKGTCNKCRVKVDGKDWVQACKALVKTDMVVDLPQLEVSLYRKSEKSELNWTKTALDINPGIMKVCLEVEQPTLENQCSDAQRLLGSLGENIEISIGALRTLPDSLRQGNHRVTVTKTKQKIVAVEAGDTRQTFYGLAVDIGTTTVVASLMDLTKGKSLGTASATNVQNIFGADVIARIEHAVHYPNGLRQLQQRVVQVINRLTTKLTQAAEVSNRDVFQVAVAGNTTMGHLFLGLNPANLAPAPYIPVTVDLIEMDAQDLGIDISPHAPVYVLPNIAGYVGGDTVAVILATEIENKPGVYLALDVGTNGEIVLAVHGTLYACSTAAGPAFEGAQIRFGMRAAAGAIEGVKVANDVTLKIIDGGSAKGICGSGLIDAVGELFEAGIINASGRMLTPEEADHLPVQLQKRLGRDDDGTFFTLAFAAGEGDSVILTQKDVRELQLAKAAMRAGIEILLHEAGITVQELDGVLLAGAFGSYLDIKQALVIGLLPPVPEGIVESVGNAAGMGARLVLLSQSVRENSLAVARKVTHVELSARPDFQELFIEAIGF